MAEPVYDEQAKKPGINTDTVSSSLTDELD